MLVNPQDASLRLFVERIQQFGQWHVPPAFLYGHIVIHRNKSDLQVRHHLETLFAQRGVMAAMVANLINDSAPDQVRARCRGSVGKPPGKILPGKPVAHLGVGREQKDVPPVNSNAKTRLVLFVALSS